MKAWIRQLSITLTSSALKKSIKFSSDHENELNIDVRGVKYMSTLKDTCVIRISNLTYKEIVQIIQGKFYDVEVKAGYKDTGMQTMFTGGVLQISNSLDDTKTNTVILLCASKLVAKYGQSRITLSLNSGINLYSALKFVCKRAGIPNSNVSTQFKKTFIDDVLSINESSSSWIDKLCSNDSNLIVNTDGATNATFSIFDSSRSNGRIIKLRNDNINLVGGYPRLTNQGLSLSVMPTLSFMCGDVIEIDNSIISLPTSSSSEIQKNYGYYLDRDGMYMIIQIDYALQNRSSQFSLNLTCKARSLISNFVGGTS